MSEKLLLEMVDICKSFPGVKALDKVSFKLRRGTVHALMGENGAGKSTLMKCLFGIYSKDSGRILLNGEEVSFKNPKDALVHGVAMVHQELNQALKRNVSDNVWLGRYPKDLGFVVSERQMHRETKKLLSELGISTDPKTVMSRMSVAERQMVEIAKAVSYNAEIIVLDEPTSSLTEQEVEHLFKIIDMLKARGCGIIYISHKMEEILRISDDITVMRDGTHIVTKPADQLTMDGIIKYMVGRELTSRFPERENTPAEVVLSVKELSSRHNHVKEVSFELRRGEILGFAGLAGAGRTELIENIFGISERSGGEIYLHGKRIRNKNPREAIRNGFALLTEERRATGIFGILNICENTTVAGLKKYKGLLGISDKERKRDTRWAIDAMKIKTPSMKTQIRTLSGGNQQKVILGRWLLTEPEILMLDEPTRGIDVGAKYEIYQLICDLAKRGKSIIVLSSELPELLGLCDRICVMSGGRLTGELDSTEATQEKIMTLAAKNL
ncbi:MAG: ATP-binding cassette domain-containing protein [Ruminococcaceae bacterium]|nr:ATP-binding cassette domain-containing protein [Oscillospiraceae bacterium]